jgi:bacterial/archaeal transporter family-2 protein
MSQPLNNMQMETSNNYLVMVILSLVSGALIPIQATSNAALSKAVGNPLISTFIVLLIAIISVSIYILIAKTPMPEISKVRDSPTYGYFGGIIVTFYIMVITFITPRLGVGASIGLIITGQIIGAVIIDHFGLFDTTVKTIDLKRLMGTLFMIVGIYFVMKK